MQASSLFICHIYYHFAAASAARMRTKRFQIVAVVVRHIVGFVALRIKIDPFVAHRLVYESS